MWTSSGVTAGELVYGNISNIVLNDCEGADMANAFLIHLVGAEYMKVVRSIVELSERGQDEDEFASYYGLTD